MNIKYTFDLGTDKVVAYDTVLPVASANIVNGFCNHTLSGKPLKNNSLMGPLFEAASLHHFFWAYYAEHGVRPVIQRSVYNIFSEQDLMLRDPKGKHIVYLSLKFNADQSKQAAADSIFTTYGLIADEIENAGRRNINQMQYETIDIIFLGTTSEGGVDLSARRLIEDMDRIGKMGISVPSSKLNFSWKNQFDMEAEWIGKKFDPVKFLWFNYGGSYRGYPTILLRDIRQVDESVFFKLGHYIGELTHQISQKVGLSPGIDDILSTISLDHIIRKMEFPNEITRGIMNFVMNEQKARRLAANSYERHIMSKVRQMRELQMKKKRKYVSKSEADEKIGELHESIKLNKRAFNVLMQELGIYRYTDYTLSWRIQDGGKEKFAKLPDTGFYFDANSV
ncbi:MAG: hypothetical protein ABIJ34_04540 [archaeon]